MSDFEKALVRVRQGWLQGYTEQDLKIFKGIPYAAPPVGALRFCRPQEPASWRGIRRATQYSAAAIQHVMDLPDLPANTHGVPQALAPSQYEEDCLYLNIWTPAKAPSDRLPVFLWVHGGGMVAGSGCEIVCDGTGFASRRDVIVVTINYRLNLFGFFAHPELTEEGGGSCGNYALFDMRHACRWVKENISQFGGDPERITVAGQSGGAAGTGALHASPLMKGLIQRVSIESGPVYWGFMKPQPMAVMEQRGIEFMRRADCQSIAQLRQKDAWELFDLYEEFASENGGMPHAFSFCVDGAFLPKPYEEMIDNGEFNDFDVMIGSCAQEFPCVDAASFTTEAYQQWLAEEFPENLENMRRWYPASTGSQAAKQVSTIASDIMLMGSIRLAQKCRDYGHRAYVWLMSKENETPRGHAEGCPHCGEMPYVFGTVDRGERSPFFEYIWQKEDYAFMELIQGYWRSYAATGDPNGGRRPEWKTYRSDFDVDLLCNQTHMLPSDQMEKYHYFMEKLMRSSYAVGIRCLPRFTPKEGKE